MLRGGKFIGLREKRGRLVSTCDRICSAESGCGGLEI